MTHASDFSDGNDRTLIPHGSDVYQKAANLTNGATVVFSGEFVFGDLDYLKVANLTVSPKVAQGPRRGRVACLPVTNRVPRPAGSLGGMELPFPSPRPLGGERAG